MYSIKKIASPFIFLVFLLMNDLYAQPRLLAYSDIGSNNASSGLFLKAAAMGHYQLGKNSFDAGFQMDLISSHKPLFSGFSGKISRQIVIKKLVFEIQSFYIHSPFSTDLKETNWGILLDINPKHFTIKFGTDFRTYAYNKSAAELYGFDQSNKIHENWNLVYSLGYYVKQHEHIWNLGLTITNIDHFLINQETNPAFNLRTHYQVRSSVDLFLETWYKSAGAFNLSVNYFGFFVRTGIVWEIG